MEFFGLSDSRVNILLALGTMGSSLLALSLTPETLFHCKTMGGFLSEWRKLLTTVANLQAINSFPTALICKPCLVKNFLSILVSSIFTLWNWVILFLSCLLYLITSLLTHRTRIPDARLRKRVVMYQTCASELDVGANIKYSTVSSTRNSGIALTGAELTRGYKEWKLRYIYTHIHRPRRGVEVQLYSFMNLGTSLGWVANATPRPLYPRDRDPVTIVLEAGWAPRPVWTDAKNLASTGIRSPDPPARSEFLLYIYIYIWPEHVGAK